MTKRALRFDSFQPSSEKASRIASRIRSTNTKGEVLLRSVIWKLGFRFRKNVNDLPGKPDIVFPRERVAIFCDGDFWHGRNWEQKKEKIKQGSNAPYWLSKIEANIERDKRHNMRLRELNWSVLRFWESDILADPTVAATIIKEAVLSKRTN
jgi:DNA mismatch endonuclease (patch repair protein)